MSGLVSLLLFHVVFRLADENCTGKMMRPTPLQQLLHATLRVRYPGLFEKHDSPPAPPGSRISKKCVTNIRDPRTECSCIEGKSSDRGTRGILSGGMSGTWKMVCCIISIKSILILSTVYWPGASMMMSGRKILAETRKVEELKSQQEAEGVQVVSLMRLKYLAMAASFSATLCGCCDVAGETTHVGSSTGCYHLT